MKEVGGGGVRAREREPDKWLVGGEERLKGREFLRLLVIHYLQRVLFCQVIMFIVDYYT